MPSQGFNATVSYLLNVSYRDNSTVVLQNEPVTTTFYSTMNLAAGEYTATLIPQDSNGLDGPFSAQNFTIVQRNSTYIGSNCSTPTWMINSTTNNENNSTEGDTPVPELPELTNFTIGAGVFSGIGVIGIMVGIVKTKKRPIL